MFRLTIKLVIAGLIAHAAYRCVPPYWNYIKFRDAVEEAVMYHNTPSFSGHRQTPDQLLDKLAQLADDNNVPLDRSDFQLAVTAKEMTIDARYTVEFEYFPKSFKPHEFVIHAEGEPSKYRTAGH